MPRNGRSGFTLIELLVVISIVSVLLTLLLPALQTEREAARRIQCMSNLKQLGLGLQQYELTYSVYPPALVLQGVGNTVNWSGGWGVPARIFAFMEQSPLFSAINFVSNHDDPINSTVTAQSLGVLLCPSETSPQPYRSVCGLSGVTNYGYFEGDWYAWGGFGSPPNRSAFAPNLARPAIDFLDGLSTTMMAAEVRTRQYVRTRCGVLSTLNTPSQTLPADQPPDSVTALLANDASPCVLSSAGHVSWASGEVDQSGVTTAWRPNTRVAIPAGVKRPASDSNSGATDVDLDLMGIPESSGGPTYAAVTSRSYHLGGVNVLFGDGSVHFIKDRIDGNVWRALGTVSGGEVIGADQF